MTNGNTASLSSNLVTVVERTGCLGILVVLVVHKRVAVYPKAAAEIQRTSNLIWRSIMRSLLVMHLLLVGMATGLIVDPPNAKQQPAKTDAEKLKDAWILVSNESRGIIAEIFGQV